MMIVLPLLVLSYRRFPLTSLLYACIFAHAVVLMVGGAYTYARVPLGFQLAEWLDLQRNPYDRIGHFFRASFRRWPRARSCCAVTMCAVGACWLSWWSASCWPSAPATS